MLKEETPTACFEILKTQQQALLIDCRSAIEWELLGTADLSSLGKKTLLVEWTTQSNQRNPDFLDQISQFATKQTPIIIMCRIGGRSASAGHYLLQHGFTNVTNMLGGYEGKVDQNGHRNSIEGWRADQLPWQQS